MQDSLICDHAGWNRGSKNFERLQCRRRDDERTAPATAAVSHPSRPASAPVSSSKPRSRSALQHLLLLARKLRDNLSADS
jgi:hypothetical protein